MNQQKLPFPAERKPWETNRVRLEGSRKRALDTGRNRVVVTAVLFGLAFSVIAGRLVELTVLDHFISTRYNDDDKVTLVTTNFKDKLEVGQEDNKKSALSNARYTLEEKIGPRIFSRLMEMCKKVHLQGKDFRQV